MVVDRIRHHHVPLKFVLKTKDDPFFIRRWVAHHRKISGLDGLVIFDNESTHPDVLSFYREIEAEAVVVRFGGLHNNLHRVHEYTTLYQALSDSCSYFAFLDSDEFVYWFEESGQYLDDARMIDRILATQDVAIPGMWLENALGYSDRLWLSTKHNHLRSGLRSGKPLLSRAAPIEGMINHNFQLPQTLIDQFRSGNLVVAHLKRLLPMQRIRTNINKIRKYRKLSHFTETSDFLNLDPEEAPPGNVRKWVSEIHEFSRKEGIVVDDAAPLKPGQILLRDGHITFSTEAYRDSHIAFLHTPKPTILEAVAGNPGQARDRFWLLQKEAKK